ASTSNGASIPAERSGTTTSSPCAAKSFLIFHWRISSTSLIDRRHLHELPDDPPNSIAYSPAQRKLPPRAVTVVHPVSDAALDNGPVLPFISRCRHIEQGAFRRHDIQT